MIFVYFFYNIWSYTLKYQLLKITNLIHWIKNKFIQHKAFDRNEIIVDPNIIGHIRLNVQGYENYIYLSNVSVNSHSVIIIDICGNNNKIILNNVYIGDKLTIRQGQDHINFGEIHNSVFEVCSGTSIEDMRYITYNSNSYCKIGNNCMISSSVTLFNTDAHPIIEQSTGLLINKVTGIHIGNHCWLGEKSSVLKNTSIPDNSIIGYNAVICGKLEYEDAVYAGNPAKCVKTGITWDANGKKYGYIDN